LNTVIPNIRVRANNIAKIVNRNLAIEAAPSDIPVKPKIAAIIAMTKKIADHFNIRFLF